MFSLKSVIILLIVILAIHVVATVNYWYWIIPWFDIPMHFLGGFWLAAAFITLNSKLRIKNSEFAVKLPNYLITILITLSFAAFIGVLWEFAEFLFDIFISSGGYAKIVQQDAADTLGDLFFDLLGGLTVAIIFLIGRRKANFVESNTIDYH